MNAILSLKAMTSLLAAAATAAAGLTFASTGKARALNERPCATASEPGYSAAARVDLHRLRLCPPATGGATAHPA